jgi:hypothetical protein
MRHLTRLTVLILATALAAGLAVGTSAQEATDETPKLEPLERFDGTLDVAPAAEAAGAQPSATQERRITIRNWIIPGGYKSERFEVEGFAVVQLRGGEIVTVIDGERKERSEDEFWTIPAGTTMGIETEDDSAILQTIAVR